MDQKAILITGAARGLGLALVNTCVRRGFKTLALVRNVDDAHVLTGRFGAACIPIVTNVCDPFAEVAIATALERSVSSLDTLINNAGVAGFGSELAEVDLKQVDELFQVHCIGALRCARAALPFLIKSRRAVMVNVTSRLGSISQVARGSFNTERHSYAYRIAKAAQNMATACLSVELGAQGVIVLAVHPGKMRTELASYAEGLTPAEAAEKLIVLVGEAQRAPTSRYCDIDGNILEW